MKLLITGFMPFDGQSVNPSWEAVSALPDKIGCWELTRLLLPVEYENAPRLALQSAEEIMPQAIVCVGQAGGRDAVTPEVIGINLREGRIPDNAGVVCQGSPIDPNGPDGLFSTLPVRRMAEAITGKGIPAKLSYSAGAYVCNDLLYSLLNHYRNTPTRVGFIHVPFLPGQGTPNLPLDQIVAALTAAIEAL